MAKPGLLQRGPMRRRLRTLRRRREAMLLDLGALVLEMHRHGRFLPDAVARRAAEAVGTDAELRSLSRALEAGDGNPDLIAAGVAGNCDRCGALHTLGASYCAQCGTRLEPGRLPRAAVLGRDPELAGVAAAEPRRTARAPLPASAPAAAATQSNGPTVAGPPPTEPPPTAPKPPAESVREPVAPPRPPIAEPPLPPPGARRVRATRVRQRLNEPARPSPPLPAGLLAGVAAGLVVIGLGALILTSGGDGGEEKPAPAAREAPVQRPPEPPPDDEPITPTPEPSRPQGQAAPRAALEPVADVTAEDYDPAGDDQEHAEEAALAVDGDPGTSWPTEEYETGDLQKDGVGLYLAPPEPLPARGLDLSTTTPGFDITIYGAEGSTPPSSLESGWTQIASEEAVPKKGRIDLDAAGRDFAYYLVWITKLPREEDKVEISEAKLLR